VDDIDRRIAKHGGEFGRGTRDAQSPGAGRRALAIRAHPRNGVSVAGAANGFDVMRAHEACSDDSRV
jgi:hypothetical protein